MLIRSLSHVRLAGGGPLEGVPVPLSLTLDDLGAQATLSEDEGGTYRLIETHSVDHCDLELVENSGMYQTRRDGSQVAIPQIRVDPSAIRSASTGADVIAALAFLLDRQLMPSVTLDEPPKLIPEQRRNAISSSNSAPMRFGRPYRAA